MAAPDPASRRGVLSRDTDEASERLQLGLWRAMTAGARLRSAADASVATRQLAAAGIRLRDPGADARARWLAMARLTLGADLAGSISRYASASQADPPSLSPIEIALTVARVLERCGLRYVVGGSLASSVAGEPRSTIDIDLMVEMTERTVACVLEGLGADFHGEAEGFTRAIRDRSSVNVIHIPTATKIDLFIMGALSIEPVQMERRRSVQVSPGASLYVYTPEDILLQKLNWYALGHGVSDRQWRDILGIIAVQGDRLDLAYLRTAATEIGIAGLLAKALAAAPST